MVELAQALAAALMALAALWSSHAVALKLLPSGSAGERWTAASGVWLWGAIAGFELLAAAGAFGLWSGLALAALSVVAIQVWTRAGVRPFERVAEDWRDAAAAIVLPGPERAMRLVLLGLLAAFAVRVLILPPLGWDTMTYHGVKAAMFSQLGGGLPLDTPGGFSAYRYYPAGGEVLMAWAGIAMPGDLLAGPLEFVQWALLFPALRVIGRELGAPEALRSTFALVAMATPAIVGMLGSGYVEPTLNLGTLSGLALLLISRGRPALMVVGAMALGAAAATKFSAVALPVVGGVWAIAGARSRSRRWWLAFGAAGLGEAAASVYSGREIAWISGRNNPMMNADG